MNKPFLTINLPSEIQSLALGAKLGKALHQGDFLGLTGPLGAGKTTLSRGIIRAFVGENIDVPSPTFTLVQTYNRHSAITPATLLTESGLDLYHFDLYRLKNSEEVWELGWEDLACAVALVEWPDKAGEHLPDDRLDVILSFDGDGRKAEFYTKAEVSWKDRLHGV